MQVEIETLTKDCWRKCPHCDITSDKFYGWGATVLNRIYCANLPICLHAVDVAEEEDE